MRSDEIVVLGFLTADLAFRVFSEHTTCPSHWNQWGRPRIVLAYMEQNVPKQRPPRMAYAGLDFIKAAFCPLEFNAMKLQEHPGFVFLKNDEALADLEVGHNLNYPRQFPYTDIHGNRKNGTQIITAPFGLAPKDFDMFLGLYTYLKKQPELPSDGQLHVTIDFLARQLQLPVTCQKDYLRVRSRLFRFSYVKYTNTALWNVQTKSYDIVNFGFYNLAALSRFTQSRRPISLQWDPTFLNMIGKSAFLSFDFELYRTLSPVLRRFYLIANRDGWNQLNSSIYQADAFAIHQIGYRDDAQLGRLRLQKLKRMLAEAEDLGLIRPSASFNGYFQKAASGPHAGQLLLRWSRGPALRTKQAKEATTLTTSLDADALYAQCIELTDENMQPMNALTFRRLVSEHGRDKMQKHIAIILAQKEHQPKSFKKSEVAAYVNRLQNDHPAPDWYVALQKEERLAVHSKVEPNQFSSELYGTLFHK